MPAKPKRAAAPTIAANPSEAPKSFNFRTGLLILSVAVTLPYLPILAGYVPFPAEAVVQFPPWEGSPARACCAGFEHAEQGDYATQYWPWRAVLNSKFSPTRVPLWNFQALMGAPFVANAQSAVFFPLNWLYSLFATPVAWSLLFPIRAVFMAVMMAVFVKRLGASPMASLISGFTFASCGWIASFQGRPNLDTAMWLPLMFLAVDELRAKPSRTSVALGAVAFALPVLGGQPETAFQVIFAAFLYAVYRLFPVKPMGGWYVAAFGAAGVLAILLAAVQLLPTLEWVGLLDRTLAIRWIPLPWTQVMGLLSRDLLHHPNVDGVQIPEGACYIGAFTAATLPFLVFWRKRRDVFFFAALAFFCLEIAYGWQPGFWISQHIPVLSGLPNWRLLSVPDFAFAVLAGFAISALEARSDKPELHQLRMAPVAWLLAGAGAGALIVLRIAGITGIALRFNLILVLLSLAIALLAAFRRIHSSDFLRTAAIVTVADLTVAGFAFVPFVKSADIFPSAPVFDFLRSRANPLWRVSGVDTVYGPQYELPYGLSTASGYDSLVRHTAKFLSVFKTEGRFQSDDILAAPKGILDLTGTRYFISTDWNTGTRHFAALPNRFRQIFSQGHIQVFENPDAVPLISFLPATAVQVADNDDAQFQAITRADFDGRRTLVIPRKIDRFWGNRGSAISPSVSGVTQTHDQVTLAVAADQDGFVYFNESEYPGWIAEVDGVKVPVIRANYAFMAVPVAKGNHTVRFEFAPTSFRIGGFLSAFAVLLIIGNFAIPLVLRFAQRQRLEWWPSS